MCEPLASLDSTVIAFQIFSDVAAAAWADNEYFGKFLYDVCAKHRLVACSEETDKCLSTISDQY